jgi:NADPH:quinone reductase-like Zn-dependent oxidoreductase
MKALVTTGKGGPDVLRIEERPAPEPRRGQVRIAVPAPPGSNFADILARVGLYPDAPKLPAVVGSEVPGEVDSVGEGVDGKVAPGDPRRRRHPLQRIRRARRRAESYCPDGVLRRRRRCTVVP